MEFREIENYVRRLGFDSNEEYNLFTNNCQDFANKIIEFLGFPPVVTQVKKVKSNPIKAVGTLIKKII